MTDKQKFLIEGMDCADCALTIERGVGKLDGVRSVAVNFSTAKLLVEGRVDPEGVKRQVEKLGYRLVDKERELSIKPQPRFIPGFIQYLFGTIESKLVLVGGGLILLGFILHQAGLPVWLTNTLQIAALAVAGFPIARSAVNNLIINRSFSINFLMTVAAIGAVIIGEIPEAASLIFLFSIAEALEGYTADRARGSLRDLAALAPPQAIRLNAGREETLPVENLRIADRILVKPGERIPMDGRIAAGSSQIDQAPITGESMPVEKSTGDEVFAGTVNGTGALEIEVTRLVKDNTLTRIIHMVEEAQASRAPAQRFIDQFSRYYTPAMILLALLVAAIPPLLLGEPFLNQADGTRGWLYRGLALLVIGCPCALVISTPVTIVSAITAAARRGVLIKGGIHLEALHRIKVVAFDKTGTLTLGRPVVTDARSMECSGGDTCLACDDMLALAASIERRSSHPLAQAVVSAAEQRGLAERYAPAEAVVALKGRGLQGNVNGRTATVGNHNLFDAEHPHDDRLCDWVDSAEEMGHTTMLVSDGDRVRGYLAVSDAVRPESVAVVRELKTLGKEVVMLTGDNPRSANSVSTAVGVDQVQASLLPEDKVTAVQALRERSGDVVMVGDGINDTPALAAATVGIAMGGAASAQAMETADVVLMGEGLSQLPYTFRLAGFTRRVVIQNIVFSLTIKFVFILLALFGWTSMWMAVLADMGVSLLVTFNGMRPLRFEFLNSNSLTKP
ncbi:MAG: heavy metal translocating P-type ATPase [Bellilinea sp.]